MASRVYLKLRHTRRLHLDDYILLFATVCFIAATGLYYHIIDGVYLIILLGSEPNSLSSLGPEEFKTLLAHQLKMLKLQAAFYFLICTTIVSVKVGFLYFYGKVVELNRRLRLFWKITVVITVICGIYFTVVSFIACPHFGPTASMIFHLPRCYQAHHQ